MYIHTRCIYLYIFECIYIHLNQETDNNNYPNASEEAASFQVTTRYFEIKLEQYGTSPLVTSLRIIDGF